MFYLLQMGNRTECRWSRLANRKWREPGWSVWKSRKRAKSAGPSTFFSCVKWRGSLSLASLLSTYSPIHVIYWPTCGLGIGRMTVKTHQESIAPNGGIIVWAFTADSELCKVPNSFVLCEHLGSFRFCFLWIFSQWSEMTNLSIYQLL